MVFKILIETGRYLHLNRTKRKFFILQTKKIAKQHRMAIKAAEMASMSTFNFDNIHEKCSLCFESLKTDELGVEISEMVETTIFEFFEVILRHFNST